MAPDPRIAVCPGSYDPVTNGHIDIISRASSMFDELIVAVVNASVRKSKSLFDAEERIGFIERATAHLGNVRVVPFDKLVVDFAREQGAKAIVKGLRAISDFEYELEMNQLNRIAGLRRRVDLPDGVAAVQFPVIQRSQGDRHFRRRRIRTRTGGGRPPLAGSAGAVAKRGAKWTSWY